MARPLFVSLAAARTSLALALAATAALALGCDRSSTEPDAELRFETLAKTSVPAHGSSPPPREVVRDAARYAEVWRELWGPHEVARPPVDFARQMVVVATHSVDPCLGDVAIERLEREGLGGTVRMGESAPHLCSCVQAETTFHVVRAPRLPGEVEFVVHRIPARCG
jgi:hypothetical protein